MTFAKHRLVPVALLLCGAVALPALAASSTASLASQGVSTSVGSLSTSLKGSSDSSSKPTPVAEGDYKITDVAAAPDQPGMLRLTLQAAAGQASDALVLDLPEATVAQAKLVAGHTVSAHQRPYGMELAHADTQQAFFLLLADDWTRELQTKVVTL